MVVNMSSDMRWRIYVKNLETHIRVGIHDHEQTPQRVMVNVSVEGVYPIPSQSIEECFNYDHIHKLVVTDWSNRSHTQLLETLVLEVLHHVFVIDKRVDYVKASLCKPDIFKEAESVGVEAEW